MVSIFWYTILLIEDVIQKPAQARKIMRNYYCPTTQLRCKEVCAIKMLSNVVRLYSLYFEAMWLFVSNCLYQ